MGRFQCPSCSSIVEGDDPARLVCPNCGYGSSQARTAAPAYAGGGFTQQPSYGSPAGGYSAPPPGYGTTPYGQPPPTGTGPPKASGMAVTSMILGIVSFCLLFFYFAGAVTAILAVIFGIMGIRQANQNPQRIGGKGMAVAGIVLGGIVLFFVLLGVLFFAAFWEEILREIENSWAYWGL